MLKVNQGWGDGANKCAHKCVESSPIMNYMSKTVIIEMGLLHYCVSFPLKSLVTH